MMTIEEIRTGKEGQTFDLKSIQIDPKALAIPIVAMANADGGMLAIGISDKTRRIEGVNQHTAKLNELLRVPFDFCNPSIPVACRYMDCTDDEGNPNRILLMDIPASQFLHTNQADEAYIRVGDKSRKLTFEERMQLMYDKGERSYEDTVKMFDDRLVFESPGKLPGQVKPSNIRNTHFSRNPKIAAFLKAYHYVKEFGEGMDRICREQEANGAQAPSFRTDDFILKITVPKVNENGGKVTEKVNENDEKVTVKVNEKRQQLIEKLIEKAKANGDKLTENRITILELMIDNPYVSVVELAKTIGISVNSIMRNIDYLRGKYLRRVGPDKGGFWEIIE